MMKDPVDVSPGIFANRLSPDERARLYRTRARLVQLWRLAAVAFAAFAAIFGALALFSVVPATAAFVVGALAVGTAQHAAGTATTEERSRPPQPLTVASLTVVTVLFAFLAFWVLAT